MAKKKEKMFLVKYEDNWADEMDIYGCAIMSEKDVDAYFKAFRKVDASYSWYIGTNEEINFYSYEDFKHKFEIKEISPEEAKVLSKFGFERFGLFPPEPEENN